MRYADDLAYIHHTGFADLARGAAAFVVDRLQPQSRVIDLGCGSGVVLRALTDAGHDAIGVDLSKPMLKIARRVAPKAKLVHSSLYDVDIPPCDAVLAIGEPLNYGDDPVKPLFRKIARALRPTGQFVFDVIVDRPGRSLTRRAYAMGEDWATLVDTREHGRALVRDITYFVKRGETYTRSREVHHVRLFRTQELVRDLRAAGFRVRVTTSYGDHRLAVRRRAFLCTL